eukprot:3664374-Pleurochrysis_carterae.AAC.1
MPIEGTQPGGHALETRRHRGAGYKSGKPHSRLETVPIEAAVEIQTSEWDKVRGMRVARQRESCAQSPRHEKWSPQCTAARRWPTAPNISIASPSRRPKLKLSQPRTPMPR